MKRLSWPRERRLLKHAQFSACYDHGTKIFSKHFVLFVLPREDSGSGIRIGLTVGRKVGNAVARNRVKRVLREYFRLHQNQLDCPADIVVVPKRTLDPAQLDLALASGDLSPALRRLPKVAPQAQALAERS
ncbi:MAG: ribonuclease P protein component [Desulfovibrio sp.]